MIVNTETENGIQQKFLFSWCPCISSNQNAVTHELYLLTFTLTIFANITMKTFKNVGNGGKL